MKTNKKCVLNFLFSFGQSLLSQKMASLETQFEKIFIINLLNKKTFSLTFSLTKDLRHKNSLIYYLI